MLEQIFEHYSDEEFMIADGFNEAVIGVAMNEKSKNEDDEDEYSMRLIYSVSKCLEILIAGGMDGEEAAEYFEFNVAGAYMGEKTPVWCYDNF